MIVVTMHRQGIYKGTKKENTDLLTKSSVQKQPHCYQQSSPTLDTKTNLMDHQDNSFVF